MKIKFTKFTKAMLFCFVISLSSCEKDLYENLTNTNTESLAFSTKIVALKDIPDVELFINNKVGDIASKSKTGKSTSSLPKITFDINKIIEVTDTIKNKNYSIRFVFDDTPENVFFNLIINVLSTGEKVPFVEKYTCAISNFTTYKNSQYNFNNFQGTVELFKANVFFGKTAILGKKSGDDPCLPKFYPNGDPIPQVSSFVYAGGSTSGSGGTSSTGTTTTGSYPNVATGGQGIFVTGTSSSGTSTSGGSTGCCSCGNCGTHWYMPTRQKDHVQMKTAADPCPDIVPIGYIGVSAEPEKLQMLRAELQISLQQWQWLHGKDELMDLILTYIHSSKDVNSAKENSLLAIEFCTNKTKTEYLFAMGLINQQIQNTGLILDIDASFKSPFNIDKSTITDATPEGEKFNKIYEVLENSVLYKKLFINLFDKNDKINVKFELVSNLIGKDGKTINGSCSEPTLGINGGKYITIKINKDNLSSGPKTKTLIFNIKTIIHESIHAYLYMKKLDANNGIPIPGLSNEDFAAALEGYNYFNDDQDQHDFMFLKMVPTIKIILSQIRDAVITQDRIDYLKDQSIQHNAGIPTTLWTWEEYYGWLSLGGLEQSPSFIKKYPKGSDGETVFKDYLNRGELSLNKEF
ncbi:MAG: hypothetical protein ACI9FW_002105 [Flavobacterium sp.]|jgi:hypothetical protein